MADVISNVPEGSGVKKEEEEDEEDDLFWASEEEEVDEEEEDEVLNHIQPKAIKKNLLQFGEILAKPLPTRYSCEALCRMIEKGQIDLEPEYQRGVVWKTEKQSAVIDSILRNYYVPPVLFSIHAQENEDGDVEEYRICVDGKQRLTSIHSFMTNKIPIREPKTGRSFYYNYSRSRRLCLTEKQREKFSQIQINCIEYSHLNEERERDMFQRVQMGVSLTPAEKASANLGPWPDFVRECVKRFVENDELNLRHVIKMDRGRDFSYITMITLLILNCKEKAFIPSAPVVDRFFKAGGAPLESQKKIIIAALTKLTVLANDEENNAPLLPLILPRRAPKSIAPMEFVFAAYVCFRFPQANHAQLSQLIKGMQMRVRGEHSDVMVNAKNEKTLRNYIREMEQLHPFWMATQGANGVNGRKRRRGENGEEEDDAEWVPEGERVIGSRSQRDYLG